MITMSMPEKERQEILKEAGISERGKAEHVSQDTTNFLPRTQELLRGILQDAVEHTDNPEFTLVYPLIKGLHDSFEEAIRLKNISAVSRIIYLMEVVTYTGDPVPMLQALKSIRPEPRPDIDGILSMLGHDLMEGLSNDQTMLFKK